MSQKKDAPSNSRTCLRITGTLERETGKCYFSIPVLAQVCQNVNKYCLKKTKTKGAQICLQINIGQKIPSIAFSLKSSFGHRNNFHDNRTNSISTEQTLFTHGSHVIRLEAHTVLCPLAGHGDLFMYFIVFRCCTSWTVWNMACRESKS